MADLGDTIIISCKAVANVLLISGAGALLARLHIFTDPGQKVDSQMYFYLFLPCLMLSTIPPSINGADLLEWWPLLVIPIIYVFGGFVLGYGFAFAFRKSPDSRRFAGVVAGFGNTISLPLALIQSLAFSVDFLTPPGGDVQETYQRGTSYVLIFNLVNNLLRWTIAYDLLRARDPPTRKRSLSNSLLDVTDPAHKKSDGLVAGRTVTFPLNDIEPVEKPVHKEMTMKERFKKMMNLPTMGLLFGLFIGLIPPIKSLFFQQDDEDPYLDFVEGAVTSLGNMAVPATLLILGGKMSKGVNFAEKIDKWTVAMVVFIRLFIMPAFGLAVVELFDRFELMPADPSFKLVLLINNATPTAVNLIVICVLHESFEAEMGTVLFVGYVVGTVTVTGWISAFIAFVQP